MTEQIEIVLLLSSSHLNWGVFPAVADHSLMKGGLIGRYSGRAGSAKKLFGAQAAAWARRTSITWGKYSSGVISICYFTLHGLESAISVCIFCNCCKEACQEWRWEAAEPWLVLCVFFSLSVPVATASEVEWSWFHFWVESLTWRPSITSQDSSVMAKYHL